MAAQTNCPRAGSCAHRSGPEWRSRPPMPAVMFPITLPAARQPREAPAGVAQPPQGAAPSCTIRCRRVHALTARARILHGLEATARRGTHAVPDRPTNGADPSANVRAPRPATLRPDCPSDNPPSIGHISSPNRRALSENIPLPSPAVIIRERPRQPGRHSSSSRCCTG